MGQQEELMVVILLLIIIMVMIVIMMMKKVLLRLGGLRLRKEVPQTNTNFTGTCTFTLFSPSVHSC